MQQNITIAAASLRQRPLAWQQNKANILQAIEQSKALGVSLLCLPELSITSYDCQDLFFYPEFVEKAFITLTELIPYTKGLTVALGLPLYYEDKLYNVVALVSDTELLGIVPKEELPKDGIHYENRWFTAWLQGKTVEVKQGDLKFTLGDQLFRLGKLCIGIEICHEAWVSPRKAHRLIERGANLILNPSASHYAINKAGFRKNLITDLVEKSQIAYIYANQLGCPAGKAVYAGDRFLTDGKQVFKQGKLFSYQNVILDSIELALDELGKDNKPHDVADFIHARNPATVNLSRHNSANFIELTQAACMGLFDYLTASGAYGYALSLSGGMDSSIIASLVKIMLDLAIKELGVDGARARLQHIPGIKAEANTWMQQLLVVAYQASQYSSNATKHAAQQLSLELGARSYTWSIDDLVANYLTKVIGEPLTEVIDNKDENFNLNYSLAMQNIQARSRVPGIWLLANLQNLVLLNTSNRSESLLGYTTLDGDTKGAFAPIASLDKELIKHWLLFLEQGDTESGIKAIKSLSFVNQLQPSAELTIGQTDEKELMPYALLSLFEELWLSKRLMPRNMYFQAKQILLSYIHHETHNEDNASNAKSLSEQQAAVCLTNLLSYIKIFFTRLSQSQWKREKACLGLHLDDKSVDPKTWFRFPVSASFKQELAELEAELSN